MRLKSYSTLCLWSVLIVLAGCKSKKEEKTVVVPVNVKVTAAAAEAGNTDQQISYSGTVKESKSISLAFQVPGTILSMTADKGQQVKKGQLLASVDETTFREQYNAQLAQQKLAQDNYSRISEVYKKGSIAEVKLVEAKSQMDQASAAARATYQNIAHSKLYAPSDGYIGEKTAESGDLASPGVPVYKLVKLEQVNIIVAIPEAEINTFKKGQQATIKIGALNNRTFKGTIDEVAVISEGASHNYNVKVKVPNGDGQLKPGMVANVYFDPAGKNEDKNAGKNAGKTVKADSTGISIPLIALQVDEQNKNYVYIVDEKDQKAVRREVKRGELMNDVVRITEGLTPSDRVIVSGYQKITSGTPVKIVQ